ncbi:IS701 family transposase [Streptomyces sp. TRM68367]|uniref:IS701 family transposase n=1 Tax=Streptomyces sp. TRM68367 TaxID=2758415 RepID=UPI0029343BD5|nr:IS701 family transposase [Streptomyces sp. TRM68367]
MATVDHEGHGIAFGGLLASVADCFARCETRETFARMTRGMLMELEDLNCWSLSEAIGERGPHRLHHLLSRAVWDEQAVLERTADWAVGLLDDGEGILIADETGDAKSSTDAVAAARQYSGSVGGGALCQVAVHLTFATSAGHCLIDRRLYFTKDWTADEERRELAGVPDELCFATKPHLAVGMLRAASQRDISASFFLGDEVYGGRELRTACRELGLGYVVGMRSNHQVTTPAAKLSVAQAGGGARSVAAGRRKDLVLRPSTADGGACRHRSAGGATKGVFPAGGWGRRWIHPPLAPQAAAEHGKRCSCTASWYSRHPGTSNEHLTIQ